MSNTSSTVRGLGVVVAMVFLSCAAGCLVTSSSDQKRHGNYVAPQTFDQIEPGKTTSGWVKATLGEPSSTTDAGGGSEIWKWTYTERTDSSGTVFLLCAGSGTKEQTGNAFVEIKDGVVVNKWRG